MNDLLQTTDAKKWAKSFMETFSAHNLPLTEELMFVWFANSIMAGYDAAKRESSLLDKCCHHLKVPTITEVEVSDEL